MKKYEVTLETQYTTYMEAKVVVEAESPDAARQIALERAEFGDVEFDTISYNNLQDDEIKTRWCEEVSDEN
jgi:hypothetical protein